MLAKHAHLEHDGTYVKPPADKLSYGSMLFIRSQLIDEQGWNLSKAATIATRYLMVRRQFSGSDAASSAPGGSTQDQLERSVLSYPSVQRRIVPLVAKSYAYILAGHRMRDLYNNLALELERGNTQLLADTHVASSSLKSYVTKQVIDGIEEARQALGGHGFSAYSGFASLFPTCLPSVTYEGDNYVLAQQVARAAVKTLTQQRQTQQGMALSSTMRFLRAIDDPKALPWTLAPTTEQEWLQPQTFISALELRAARRVADFAIEIERGRTLSDLSWEAVELARSHAEVAVSIWFAETVQTDAERYGAEQLVWINKLVILHALVAIQRDLTPLLLPSLPGGGGLALGSQPVLTAQSVAALEATVRTLVSELVPQSIGLTDALGWTDPELDSALGRADGRVYESLMADVEANPINHPIPDEVSDPMQLGRYVYSQADTGKFVAKSWRKHVLPLISGAADTTGDPIRGDGSKL